MAETAEYMREAEEAQDIKEISSIQPSQSLSKDIKTTSSKRNAFSELMSPKPKQSKSSDTTESIKTSIHRPNDPRSGLLPYVTRPESFPSNVVLKVTRNTVLIRDLYPKATVHLLLLPRSPLHRDLHPHDAFADVSFLNTIKAEASIAVRLAASELSRLISPTSHTDSARIAALDAPSLPPTLPTGRNYTHDFRVGIHAHPSMNHLHIHIISRDMHSSSLKHRKHYNSFNTPFFVPLDDYPLAVDDPRRRTAVQNANLKADFVCWRCGLGFGNRFKDLKAHLDVEWEAWRTE